MDCQGWIQGWTKDDADEDADDADDADAEEEEEGKKARSEVSKPFKNRLKD